MDSNGIDVLGISKLKELTTSTEKLIPDLRDYDKIPIWDGEIQIYSNSIKKENCIGKIPVQVKTTLVIQFSENPSYSVNVIDLKAYQSDGGILFIYIEVMKNPSIGGYLPRFFYKKLLPVDLNKELLSLKSDAQKSKTIHFKKIKNEDDFYNVCKSFHFHRKKQMSINDFDIDFLSQSRTYQITDFFETPTLRNSIEKQLLNKSQYVYSKTYPDLNIFDHAGLIELEKISRDYDKPVIIDGKQYFDSFKRTVTSEKEIFEFGESVEFIAIGNERTKVNFKVPSNIDEALLAIDFLLKTAENDLHIQEGEGFVESLVEKQKFYQDIVKLLSIFSIKSSTLDLRKMFEADEEVLQILIDSMLNNDTSRLKMDQAQMAKVEFGNITVCVFISNSGVFELHDYMEKSMSRLLISEADNKDDNEYQMVSGYLLLTKNHLAYCQNIKPEKVVNQIKEFEHSESYDSYVILLLLEMIAAYDLSQNNLLLEYGLILLEWLHEGGFIETEILLINRLQIKKRELSLNSQEISELNNVLKKSCDHMIRCGVYILLGKTEKTEKELLMLSEQEQDLFKSYPIYSLFKSSNRKEKMGGKDD